MFGCPLLKSINGANTRNCCQYKIYYSCSNHYIDHIFLLLKPLQGIISSCSWSYFSASDFLPLEPPVATTGKPWGHPPAHRLDTAELAHSSLNSIHCILLTALCSLHTHHFTLITAPFSVQSLYCTIHCTLCTAYFSMHTYHYTLFTKQSSFHTQ